MISYKNIDIKDYTYILPQDKIALYPVKNRDESRLLIYKYNNIHNDYFKNIHLHFPVNSILVLNNTKVVNARIYFRKPTGAQIEIFILEPENGLAELETVYSDKGKSVWKCLIGKAGKWKHGALEKNFFINNRSYTLSAGISDKKKDCFLIEFSWEPDDICFSDVLYYSGITPLPPYIKRPVEESDAEAYQTVYAKNLGSVAAPTSGFHFTGDVMEKLKNIKTEIKYLTLHIGSGTFKPVTTETLAEHIMHSEKIIFSYDLIELLYLNLKNKNNDGYRKIIAGGTTSTRALESLFVFSSDLMNNYSDKRIYNPFSVTQWMQYENNYLKLNDYNSIEFLLEKMSKHNIREISGETSLIIVPGYKYKVIDGLITNFHLPRSTLLLLVAALIGDNWKNIYKYALENNFRFLSYGDASLLLK